MCTRNIYHSSPIFKFCDHFPKLTPTLSTACLRDSTTSVPRTPLALKFLDQDSSTPWDGGCEATRGTVIQTEDIRDKCYIIQGAVLKTCFYRMLSIWFRGGIPPYLIYFGLSAGEGEGESQRPSLMSAEIQLVPLHKIPQATWSNSWGKEVHRADQCGGGSDGSPPRDP